MTSLPVKRDVMTPLLAKREISLPLVRDVMTPLSVERDVMTSLPVFSKSPHLLSPKATAPSFYFNSYHSPFSWQIPINKSPQHVFFYLKTTVNGTVGNGDKTSVIR